MRSRARAHCLWLPLARLKGRGDGLIVHDLLVFDALLVFLQSIRVPRVSPLLGYRSQDNMLTPVALLPEDWAPCGPPAGLYMHSVAAERD